MWGISMMTTAGIDAKLSDPVMQPWTKLSNRLWRRVAVSDLYDKQSQRMIQYRRAQGVALTKTMSQATFSFSCRSSNTNIVNKL